MPESAAASEKAKSEKPKALSAFSLRDHVILYDGEHLPEARTIQLKLGDVVFNAEGDLVDLDEERKLPLPERVEEFGVIVGNSEYRLSVRDEFHFGEVVIHVAGPAQIVPGPANSLDGKAIVEKALDDSQADKIAKTVDTATAGTTVRRLNRGFDQTDLVPVSKLVWRACR